ncbi:MAG: hypothetical protein ACJ74I_11435 [Gaiellaceae bacterium]|jgi:hypothetical protein
MSNPHTHLDSVSVDEVWLGDWAAEGIAAIEAYLANHAAFAAFLSARDGLDSTHGDGAAQR